MSTSQKRQAGVEVEVTPEMIEAGVQELREKCFGQPYEIIVEDVYWAMRSAIPSAQDPQPHEQASQCKKTPIERQ